MPSKVQWQHLSQEETFRLVYVDEAQKFDREDLSGGPPYEALPLSIEPFSVSWAEPVCCQKCPLPE